MNDIMFAMRMFYFDCKFIYLIFSSLWLKLGNGDLVRCFQCGIGLKDWIKDDDVMAEHIKYSSECDYLRQKIGKVEVDRLKVSV